MSHGGRRLPYYKDIMRPVQDVKGFGIHTLTTHQSFRVHFVIMRVVSLTNMTTVM